VTVRFQPVGSAPILKTKVFKIYESQRFDTVVNFLRRRLEAGRGESVFCYVNSVFAPGGDEVVGNLFRVSACYVRSECLCLHKREREGGWGSLGRRG